MTKEIKPFVVKTTVEVYETEYDQYDSIKDAYKDLVKNRVHDLNNVILEPFMLDEEDIRNLIKESKRLVSILREYVLSDPSLASKFPNLIK
jgi:hypothetical protein